MKVNCWILRYSDKRGKIKCVIVDVGTINGYNMSIFRYSKLNGGL
ncbi:hypothetical protein T23_03100 [Turicibacter faecis]|uniref:Uncharacterized protein n=1 Tax=Turicibacter faecis TaxID=2963365 RepID=A0ABN6ZEJ7_9FIRM|nr:hypothetical protein T23_03100 [Turicibacter sp. TC023]